VGYIELSFLQRNEKQERENGKEICSPTLFVPNGTKANEAVSSA